MENYGAGGGGQRQITHIEGKIPTRATDGEARGPIVGVLPVQYREAKIPRAANGQWVGTSDESILLNSRSKENSVECESPEVGKVK